MSATHPQQLLLGLQLDDAATLDNFVVTEANQQLFQHLQAKTLQSREGYTFVWGAEGTGKTHLLQALCHELASRGKSPIYVPLSLAEQIAPDMLEGLEHLDLVCLDAVDTVAGYPDWEKALFNFYNRARDLSTTFVVCAGAPPGELTFSLADLQSRLQSGVVYQVQELTDADKVGLLRQRAKTMGIDLSTQVVDFVMHRHDRQVNSLLQLLQKLDKQSLEQKRPITVPLVKQVLGD